MKKCSKCMQTKPKTEFHISKTLKDGCQPHCIACIREYSKTDNYKKAIRKYQSTTWRGAANLIRGHMKSNSKRRGHHWDDSWWPVESVLEKIEGRSCAVTGLPFELKQEQERHKKRAFIPSPDRLDNSKGYEPDNVQWVVFIYNMMKNNFDDVDVAHFLQTLKNSEGDYDEHEEH